MHSSLELGMFSLKRSYFFIIILSYDGTLQGRNEVYGIRDQRPKKGWDQGSQPLIRDHSPRDRDQRVFH